MKPAALLTQDGAPKVRLAPLSPVHLEPYIQMLSDTEIRRLTASSQVFSRTKIEHWLATRASASNRKDWAIIDENHNFLGEIVLNDFDDAKNLMNLKVSLADRHLFGHTVGRQALALALEFAFDTLSLDKVTLEVLVENELAIRSFAAVGFREGRQFTQKGQRFLRMSANKWEFVFALGQAGLRNHLDPQQWTFDFDNGKRRAGLCNYTDRRITISKHLVGIHTIDESLQVLAHEIAHALSGKAAGHGKKWLGTAKSLGYRAEKFSGNEIARERAPWVGACPAGHEHFRYRKPTRELSCGLCSKRFSTTNLIAWRKAD